MAFFHTFFTEFRVERRELREGCQDFIVCNYEAFFVEVRRPLYEHGYELNPFSRQAKPAASSPPTESRPATSRERRFTGLLGTPKLNRLVNDLRGGIGSADEYIAFTNNGAIPLEVHSADFPLSFAFQSKDFLTT